LPLNKIALYFI